MSIQINDGFKVNTALPVDSRFVVADLAARDAIDPLVRYDGLETYVIDQLTTFRLKGGIANTDWQVDGGGGGPIPAPATGVGRVLLANNSVNQVNEIGEFVTDCPALFVEYYCTRRVDGLFKTITGVLVFETAPEEALTTDRWKIWELKRSEDGGPSGITFSLTEVLPEKSVLVVTLDDLVGTAHACKFFYKITKLSPVSSKVVILPNNSINPINAIGEYIADAGAILIDYYIYRRTDSGYKTMSGKIVLESNPDALTNPAKWTLYEMVRNEGDTPSGVTFSLDDIDVEKSILVVTLDNMAGANHRCDFFYNKTVLTN
jgi:hypothetical protein